ncbi:MAG: enoyl-CoA hydratase/isomerase family protein [Ilumatobacteraceae bacterium]
MYDDITVESVGDHVTEIEIHRPPNNFFDLALIEQIADACESLAAANDCRVIVLCAAGKHFCAGANFGGGQPDGSIAGAEGRHLYDEAQRLFEQPLPIVAAVQGAAIGGGLGLALAADFRVASPEARFAANFALLGFHQGFALSVTLPALVGQQQAAQLLYTGKRVDGGEAMRIGMVDRLVPAGDLREEARAFAAELAVAAPLAVRSIRETLRADLAVRTKAAMAREKAEQDRLQHTSDWREGVAAVAERRPANFRGE